MATYKIQTGDNLTKIAKANNTSVSELAKLNNIKDTNRIITGTTLQLPGAANPKNQTKNQTKNQSKILSQNTNVPDAVQTQTTPLVTPQVQSISSAPALQPTVPPVTATNQSNQLLGLEEQTPTFTQSQAVQQANNDINLARLNKPGEYASNYSGQIQSILDQINNRDAFSYDFNADPMYQQYKDKYTTAGQMAMQDTVGEMSSLTGGYGNSYAASAGNQAYQQSLQNVNDVIPDLYNTALNMYSNEGNDLMNRLSVYQDQDQQSYQQHNDKYNRWLNDLDYATGRADTQYNREYNEHQNNVSNMQTDRAYAYGKSQDELSQMNYLEQIAYGKEMDALSQQNYLTEFEYGQSQDQLAQDNYTQQVAYGQSQDQLAQDNYTQQFQYGQSQDQIAQSNYNRDYNYRAGQAGLSQSNYLTELAYSQAQDKLAQDNFMLQFDYNKQQDSLSNLPLTTYGGTNSSAGTSLTPSSGLLGGTNGNRTANNQAKTYLGTITDLARTGGLDAADKQIETLYNSGKITEQDAVSLYQSAEQIDKLNTTNLSKPGVTRPKTPKSTANSNELMYKN